MATYWPGFIGRTCRVTKTFSESPLVCFMKWSNLHIQEMVDRLNNRHSIITITGIRFHRKTTYIEIRQNASDRGISFQVIVKVILIFTQVSRGGFKMKLNVIAIWIPGDKRCLNWPMLKRSYVWRSLGAVSRLIKIILCKPLLKTIVENV